MINCLLYNEKRWSRNHDRQIGIWVKKKKKKHRNHDGQDIKYYNLSKKKIKQIKITLTWISKLEGSVEL